MTNRSLLTAAHEHQINGRLGDALSIYGDILSKSPNQTEAIFGIAEIVQKCGQYARELQLLCDIIKIDPKHRKAFERRGQLMKMFGKLDTAISDFSAAIDLDDTPAHTFNMRGVTYAQQGKFDCAIDDFTAAIRRQGNLAEAFYNRGLAYRRNGAYDCAISDYTTTIKLDPYNFQAYNNRGIAYRELGRFEDASNDFIKSSEINPEFHDGYWNASLSLLTLGDYEKGWRLYEHRWLSSNFTSPRRNFSAPLWLGKEDLFGKTILLHSEQGLGDSLQFCRFVPLVEALGCNVILEIEKPLKVIMRSLSSHIKIVEKGTALPYFDFHCPLMSLPLAFGIKKENIPVYDAYLSVDQDKVAWWSAHLGEKKRPRIGFVWRGNAAHSNDHNRSIPLRNMLNYLSPNFDWICLQKDLSSEEEALFGNRGNVTHFGDLISDFSDTGAIVSNLDATLCVDTSVAHLCGALGRSVHLLIPFIPDFRWHSEGKRSPWYRNLKIYRQSSDRNWEKPLKHVQASLVKLPRHQG